MNKKLSPEVLEMVKELQTQCIGGSNDGKDVCKKCMTECKMLSQYTGCPE